MRKLGHEESMEALSSAKAKKVFETALKQATSEVKKLTKEQLKSTPRAPTGACCLYTYGVSSCTNGMTESACNEAARRTNTIAKWTRGWSCRETRCP